MDRIDENPNKQRIRFAAYALMHEVGYGATSYTAIAERSGCGRPLVQKHFPHKEELLLDLVADAAEACKQALRESDSQTEGAELRTLHLAQLYLATILFDEGTRRLASDALSDRSITGKIASQHHISAFSRFDEPDEPTIENASVKAIGGIHELLAKDLDEGRIPDAGDLAAQLMAGFLAMAVDAAYSAAYERMRAALLPRDVAEKLAQHVINEMEALVN